MGLVVRPSIPLRFQGGVAAPLIKRSRSLPAQTGWLVISNKIRIAKRAYREATRPFTNHPVCAAEERDLFVNGAATPPLKGGEWTRLATNRFPLPRRSSSTNQFSFSLGIILTATAGFSPGEILTGTPLSS